MSKRKKDEHQTEPGLDLGHEQEFTLLKSLPIGIYRTTPDGQILSANPALVGMLGYNSFEELARRNLEEEGYSPQYPRHRFRDEIEREGAVVSIEAAWQRRDGDMLFVRETARAVRDAEGRVLYYAGAVVDITDRKRAEQALQDNIEEMQRFSNLLTELHTVSNELSHYDSLEALYRQAVQLGLEKLHFDRVSIWIFDESKKRARSVYGVDEKGQIRDERDCWIEDWQKEFSPEILHPECSFSTAIKQDLKNHLRQVVGVGQVSVAALWDGEEAIGFVVTDNLLSQRPLTESRNQLLSLFAATLGHLHSRIQKEKQAREMVARMQEAQKLESLGVLAGGIAHDFNNLLQSILGNASLTKEELPHDSTLRGSMENIEKAALNAAVLTNQMLAYSGKGKFIVEIISLNDFLRETENLLKATLAHKGELHLQLSEPLPEIAADGTQLRQALLSLTINAVEAMGDGPGEITISTSASVYDNSFLRDLHPNRTLPEGAYVCLAVVDNGFGMDEETRLKVFEPFFSTKFIGRGLGLAAVQGIVHGHEGAIRVKSELGRGTTFELYFPVATPATTAEQEEEEDKEPDEQTTLLFADDDELVLQLGVRTLEGEGYKVLTAKDGEEAIEVFTAHADEIACIILDLTMPKKGGDETFVALRKIKPEAPVIIISGFGKEQVVNQFSKQKFNGFLQKPYRNETLLAKLREVLQKP